MLASSRAACGPSVRATRTGPLSGLFCCGPSWDSGRADPSKEEAHASFGDGIQRLGGSEAGEGARREEAPKDRDRVVDVEVRSVFPAIHAALEELS